MLKLCLIYFTVLGAWITMAEYFCPAAGGILN